MASKRALRRPRAAGPRGPGLPGPGQGRPGHHGGGDPPPFRRLRVVNESDSGTSVTSGNATGTGANGVPHAVPPLTPVSLAPGQSGESASDGTFVAQSATVSVMLSPGGLKRASLGVGGSLYVNRVEVSVRDRVAVFFVEDADSNFTPRTTVLLTRPLS